MDKLHTRQIQVKEDSNKSNMRNDDEEKSTEEQVSPSMNPSFEHIGFVKEHTIMDEMNARKMLSQLSRERSDKYLIEMFHSYQEEVNQARHRKRCKPTLPLVENFSEEVLVSHLSNYRPKRDKHPNFDTVFSYHK